MRAKKSLRYRIRFENPRRKKRPGFFNRHLFEFFWSWHRLPINIFHKAAQQGALMDLPSELCI
jgi:hypothetical protein